MKIECVLQREGGAKVDLGGHEYHFKPQTDGRHVAEVADRRHAERLLSINEAYRPLFGEKIPAAPAPIPDEEAPDIALAPVEPPPQQKRAATMAAKKARRQA